MNSQASTLDDEVRALLERAVQIDRRLENMRRQSLLGVWVSGASLLCALLYIVLGYAWLPMGLVFCVVLSSGLTWSAKKGTRQAVRDSNAVYERLIQLVGRHEAGALYLKSVQALKRVPR